MNIVFSYAPATVRLNGIEKQQNPISGQKIALLDLYSGAYGTIIPFVVTSDNPKIYIGMFLDQEQIPLMFFQ